MQGRSCHHLNGGVSLCFEPLPGQESSCYVMWHKCEDLESAAETQKQALKDQRDKKNPKHEKSITARERSEMAQTNIDEEDPEAVLDGMDEAALEVMGKKETETQIWHAARVLRCRMLKLAGSVCP